MPRNVKITKLYYPEYKSMMDFMDWGCASKPGTDGEPNLRAARKALKIYAEKYPVRQNNIPTRVRVVMTRVEILPGLKQRKMKVKRAT